LIRKRCYETCGLYRFGIVPFLRFAHVDPDSA
jgi:hypothetical protein